MPFPSPKYFNSVVLSLCNETNNLKASDQLDDIRNLGVQMVDSAHAPATPCSNTIVKSVAQDVFAGLTRYVSMVMHICV